jgi:cytochrome b6-f complex iron-sulfur subunit
MTTRRDFCIHTCQAISLATLAGALEACAGSPTSPAAVSMLQIINGPIVSGAVTVTIDATSPLSTVGSAALVQTTVGVFLVARTAQSSFTAMTAICTHQACTITGFNGQSFVCPCHGSQFSTSGAALTGPAFSSLRQFATGFSNNVLTIGL